MDQVAGLASLLLTLLTCLLVLRLLHSAAIVESILAGFVTLCALIVLKGYALSTMAALGSLPYWVGLDVAFLALAIACIHARFGPCRLRDLLLLPPALRTLRRGVVRPAGNIFVLLLPLGVTVAVVGILNLIAVVSIAPRNWDSMTYHLARVAHYLQQGSLDFYPANYWAQVVHPKNSSLIQLYGFLVSGRNENLTQALQYVSYWVSTISVYGIARELGQRRGSALFCALVFGLLIEVLMEAITPQNDLFIAALIGCAVFFLLRYAKAATAVSLIPALTAVGLAAGAKASALLALPPLVLILFSVMRHTPPPRGERTRLRIPLLLGSLGLGLGLFALPAGYWENQRLYGHPLGPERVRREHSFDRSPPAVVAREGVLNVARYALDFLSLDGLPHGGIVRAGQNLVRAPVVILAGAINVDLSTSRGDRGEFEVQKQPSAHEDLSSWGVLGFGFLWIVVLIVAVQPLRYPVASAFARAALLLFFLQCFVGPYDPWRGRYFITAAIFACPIAGLSLDWSKRRCVRVWVTLVVLLGCLSALSGVILRPIDLDLSATFRQQSLPALLARDRLDQMTTNFRQMRQPFQRFEELVPASATVAACLGPNSYEYPLFGKELTRRIVPVNPFFGEQTFRLGDAHLLVFSVELVAPTSHDTFLGHGWYLRDLRSGGQTE